jgi:uncharacterized protein YoxC
MLAFGAGDVAYIALSVFLVLVAVGFAWLAWKLGETFGRLSAFIRGAQEEVLPVVSKVGTTVDHVNAQMEKVDQMTDSVVDAVQTADAAVRTLSAAATAPVRKLSGLAAGTSHGFAELKVHRSWSRAKAAARAASAERESELDEELREAGAGGTEWPTS